jgi:hypothetical protein
VEEETELGLVKMAELRQRAAENGFAEAAVEATLGEYR